MNGPLNPLSSLAEYEPPKTHTSGRRELQFERFYERGVKVHANPKNPEDAPRAAAAGELVETLPIRRAQPKASLSKKERAKLKRERRKNGDA